MLRKVLVAGVLGGVVMIVWAFVVNGIFGFASSIAMKLVPDERAVYEVLKKNIVAPGRYVCNPAATPSGFPLTRGLLLRVPSRCIRCRKRVHARADCGDARVEQAEGQLNPRISGGVRWAGGVRRARYPP